MHQFPWMARQPFYDFGTNARGALNLLEAYRRRCPDAVRCDQQDLRRPPHTRSLVELESRWAALPPQYGHVPRRMSDRLRAVCRLHGFVRHLMRCRVMGGPSSTTSVATLEEIQAGVQERLRRGGSRWWRDP